MRRSVGLLLLLAGCAGVPTPSEQAQGVAEALADLVRAEYAVRLAASGAGTAPEPAALSRARARLDAAVAEAELPALGAEQPRAARVLRDYLLARGFAFLPNTGKAADPGIALARVIERRAGLRRELWGETVRYRRLVHDGFLVPEWDAYVAVHTGRGRLPPLGRYAAPTVYLDRAAIERRAGQGSFAHLEADALQAEVELQQVAWLRFAALPRRVIVKTGLRGALAIEAELHERVLLTLLRYGDVRAWRAVTARLAAGADREPVTRAARRVQAALSGCDGEDAVRAAAAEAYGKR